MDLNNQPTTSTQLASLFDIFIKDKLKDVVFDEKEFEEMDFLMNLKTIHLNLKIKKDSMTETFVTTLLYNFFESNGFSCDLSNPEQPHWDVYAFFVGGKRMGTFNSDIYPKFDCDKLLISISSRFS